MQLLFGRLVQGRDFLPKKRKDLQTNANRIDWRIATVGKPVVLQIAPRHSYFVVKAGRPKLPPLRLEGYKGVNNLMTIPAGSVLDSRFVRIYPDHYLSQFVQDPNERLKWGIIFRSGTPFVRIYDVIDGMAFAERRTVHILANYAEELSALKEAEADIRRVLNGPTILMSDAKLRSLNSALVRILDRQASIRRILSDQAVRGVNLHFAFQKAQSRLTQMAGTIERWSTVIREEPNRIRIGSVLQMTNPILSELPFFGSKEIRDYVNQVKIAFGHFAKRVDHDSFAGPKLATSLSQAGFVLLTAAEVLVREADSTPESEKIFAAQIQSGKL